MAHFAELDNQNKVLNVIVIGNETIGNLEFPMSENAGIEFLNTILPGKIWKQTSYNNNFRFKYAAIGDIFHPDSGEHGGFATPPNFDDWVFDVDTCTWKAPIPLPEDASTVFYRWNPEIHNWEPITLPT